MQPSTATAASRPLRVASIKAPKLLAMTAMCLTFDSIQRTAIKLRDNTLARAQRAVIDVLKAGPVPRHVAFVMDGNRRYARSQGMHVLRGHEDGFLALRRVLEICLLLGIRCVSVYAFSIDNFKRSQEEVDGLMHLAEVRLLELCEHGGVLQEYGVRLNALGKIDLFPPNVQAAVRRAEELTKDNDKAILNLCMPYTATDEIKTAVESAVQDALKASQTPAYVVHPDTHSPSGTKRSLITEKDIDDRLMTSRVGSPPLDILIRTSGVKRLSDYLLWQCAEDTQIQFINTYWPDVSLLDIVPIMLDYQRKVWCT
ncbi:Prenyltransf-domain-containing protein [Auriscalpium vulgare]|uniref:Prenyltransf-domain-containing protein n=1 Tax=Auriscalpium vulgare TaxID=40419 RepID=A0ACB8SBP9_9AGAM|nr:Prenyltransf-domain-containing protein [Auriscalpium vulgare]